MLKKFLRNNVLLSYYDSEAEGPILVFQHGLTGNHQQICQTFTDKSYRLITLECRGHGDSELGHEDDLSISTFADDLLAFLDHLEIEKVSLAGISMGAAVISCFAGRHPNRVKSLTLIRPAWYNRRSPCNLMIFSIVADYISLHGSNKGLVFFTQSEAYKELHLKSEDNARSLLNIFRKPPEIMVPLLRNVITSDPCFNASEIIKAKIPVKIVGTTLDKIHPLAKAEVVSKSLGMNGFIEVYPKTLDTEKYNSEINDIIISNVF